MTEATMTEPQLSELNEEEAIKKLDRALPKVEQPVEV